MALAKCVVRLLKAKEQLKMAERAEEENNKWNGPKSSQDLMGKQEEEKIENGGVRMLPETEMDWPSRLGKWLLMGIAKIQSGFAANKKKEMKRMEEVNKLCQKGKMPLGMECRRTLMKRRKRIEQINHGGTHQTRKKNNIGKGTNEEEHSMAQGRQEGWQQKMPMPKIEIRRKMPLASDAERRMRNRKNNHNRHTPIDSLKHILWAFDDGKNGTMNGGDGKWRRSKRRADAINEVEENRNGTITTNTALSNIAKLQRIQHFYKMFKHCERHLNEMGEANARLGKRGTNFQKRKDILNFPF